MVFPHFDGNSNLEEENKKEAWHLLKGPIIYFAILGILGLAFFFWRYDDVFPAATLDLKLSKQEVISRSTQLAESMGFKSSGCISSSTFGERSQIATFLEREYKMREANALMHDELNVFFWYTRLCKEYQEEEFQVWLDPKGRLVGMNHSIENERPLPSLSKEEAMQKALNFLREKAGVVLEQAKDSAATTVKEDEEASRLLPGIKLIRQGSSKQAQRTDHYFCWEDQRKNYKGGFVRNTVEVSGNLVTNFDSELHVPEEFERRYNDMRSYNELLKSVSTVIFSLVSVAMVLAFFWALSSKRLRWKLVLISALVTFLVEILDYWNNFPSIVQSYSSTESFNGYLSSSFLSSVLNSALAALAAAVLVGGVEAVYRTQFPKMLAAESLLNPKNLSNKSLLEPLFAGISVFGMHIGYVAVFYLIGQHVGVWSPLEVREIGTLASISPAFSSFAVGLNASVSEELLYRVLCFFLAQKLLKNFWLANLVQAASWAFMHSDYPQEPPYARGLELTIVGLFYGYLMKRYGVLAGIIAHFIYDAFLGVTMLFSSSSILLWSSALLAFSPPIVAFATGLFNRTVKLKSAGVGEIDSDLSNEQLLAELARTEASKEHGASQESEEKAFSYSPLPASLKKYSVILAALALASCLLVQPRILASWLNLSANKEQVEKTAAAFLKERGVEETGWQVSSFLSENFNHLEGQYGFEKEGYAKTERILKQARLPLLWWVRFYKPKQRREYEVALSPQGKPIALQVVEEEDAAGKKLTEAEARKLTEDFLKTYRPEYSPLEFDSSLEQERKNRSDYLITYEVPAFKLGEARLKITISTVGNLVSFPHVSWDIPDAWKFERDKETFKDQAARLVSQVFLLGLLAMGIVWGVGVFRSQVIHWRPAILCGAAIAALALLSQLNELPNQLASYDTDVPMAGFLTRTGVNSLCYSMFYGAAFALLFAFAHAAFRILYPGVSLKKLKEALFSSGKQIWLDAILSGYTFLFVYHAIASANQYLLGRFSPEVSVFSFQDMENAAHCISPSFDLISSALMMGFGFCCLAPVLRGFYLKYLRSFRTYLIFMFILLIGFESSNKHWQDFLIQAGFAGLNVLWFYFWMSKQARNNPAAYFLAAYLNSLWMPLVSFARFAPSVYQADLALLILAATLPLLIPFFVKGKASQSE